jgi:5-methylthioadenosine/S-adenosylhomocysteine deaminase
MTQLNDEEIEAFAQSGGHIVHCPESNLKLASGFCPVARCLDAGINIALGTDSTASNNDLDMIGEMRSAALLAKGVANDASVIPAHTALRMATLNGAIALGLGDEIGTLQTGKSADITAIHLNDLETLPIYDPIAQIVYASGRHQVTDVWVAGKQLLRQKNLTTINIQKLQEKIKAWQIKLAESL